MEANGYLSQIWSAIYKQMHFSLALKQCSSTEIAITYFFFQSALCDIIEMYQNPDKTGVIQLYLSSMTSPWRLPLSHGSWMAHKEAVSDPLTPSRGKRSRVGSYHHQLDQGQCSAITFWSEITYFLITYGLKLWGISPVNPLWGGCC